MINGVFPQLQGTDVQREDSIKTCSALLYVPGVLSRDTFVRAFRRSCIVYLRRACVRECAFCPAEKPKRKERDRPHYYHFFFFFFVFAIFSQVQVRRSPQSPPPPSPPITPGFVSCVSLYSAAKR